MTTTLTATLLASNPQLYSRATRPPFLQAASEGTVSKTRLACWLAADGIYVRLYVQAIGRVLSGPHLRLDDDDDDGFFSWLVDGLVGLRAEMALFERVADEYGLDLQVDVGHNKGLALFTQLFSSTDHHQQETSWFDPAVLFFATERIYLDAWTTSHQNLLPSSSPQTTDSDAGALRTTLMPNWSSPHLDRLRRPYGRHSRRRV
ncbi:Transcription regulator [Ophiocordyceps camponoti-floridani]|uniref:Transcription regulator n=1 Tax=Ophiocordyceps camponoti-floridani TaxID=2030778 RepID=A0A8H4VBZ4_9HYPO|nr:Transcription regulator [Ophiocordyceps camponoti-floridani]